MKRNYLIYWGMCISAICNSWMMDNWPRIINPSSQFISGIVFGLVSLAVWRYEVRKAQHEPLRRDR